MEIITELPTSPLTSCAYYRPFLPNVSSASFSYHNIPSSSHFSSLKSTTTNNAQTNNFTAEQVQYYLNKFEALFLKKLIYQSPKDQYEAVGRPKLLATVRNQIEKKKTIELLLPAYPYKSANHQQKVFGPYPDKGEELSLRYLHDFCEEVSSFYPFGCNFIIVNDGHVYADCVGISDENMMLYQDHSRELFPSKYIRWTSLETYLHVDEEEAKNNNVTTTKTFARFNSLRRQLMSKYAPTEAEMDELINREPGYNIVYCGFKKFLMFDFKSVDFSHLKPVLDENNQCPELFPPKSNAAYRKVCGLAAKRLMRRSEAFNRLHRSFHPEALRVSIHGHPNTGPKFAIRLHRDFVSEDQTVIRTPWHNVLLLKKDGSFELRHRSKVDETKFQLIYERERPSYFVEL